MGDFTGFSFNGIHSSRLNIVRTSNGDRYTEILQPEIEDKTNVIPGSDGNYYFGSDYRGRTISISFAFDSMEESEFRTMVQLFSTKKPSNLIFDERPYKVYTVKLAQPIQLDYICFDEPIKYYTDGGGIKNRDIPNGYSSTTRRIYKGEGSIEFECLSPWAHQQFKTLDEYGPYDDFYNKFYNQTMSYTSNPSYIPSGLVTNIGNAFSTYNNIEEWAAASGILSYAKFIENDIDTVVESTESGYNYYIPVYNPGDRDVPFLLYLPYVNHGNNTAGTLSPSQGEYITINNDNSVMLLEPITAASPYRIETGIMINNYNHLIEGVALDPVRYSEEGWTTTGNIYNSYIVSGDFGTIAHQNWGENWNSYMQAIHMNCNTAAQAKIFYNYVYY